MKSLKSERWAWGALYAAYVAVAYVLRANMACTGQTEVWGWDYGTFLGQINDWHWILFTGFRHPGLGLTMSPLVALQHVWPDAYLWFMPAVATATAWLIGRMGGRLAVAVWLAMPTTWILAGVPESFPVAQLVLVASSFAGTQSFVRAAGWAALASCVTLTNGLKPMLAWLVLRARRRDVGRLLVTGAVVCAAGAAFFAMRAAVSGKDWMEGVRATLSWIPSERQLGRELWGFFVRPVGWAALFAYPLALLGARRNRRLLGLFACYFAVDAVLHLVIGWGMGEPWVFAPHWTWMLAVLAGHALEGPKEGRKAFCPGWEDETNGMAVVAKLMEGDPQWKDERIVHGAWLPSGWFACLRFGGYVRMPHGSYDPVRLDYHGWKKKLVGPVERFFLRRADKVVATCDAEKEWILSYEPKAKVDVVDIKRYFRLVDGDRDQVKGEGEQRTVHLLYLGRRHPLKGVEFLERAVEELKRDPQFASRLRLRIVSDAVGEEKEKVWDWCDVLVLPTLTENFGLVIAEALERGKRVITTDGAPAWTPSGAEQGISSAFGGRLVYLGGYRAGNAATRIQLLKTAISALFSER